MLLAKEESQKKVEGDKCTPKGSFKFRYVFYRKDRVTNIKSKLKLVPIKKDFGWCDDVRSKYYNKFVKLPFKFSAEKLYIKKNIYDIVVVIDTIKILLKKEKEVQYFYMLRKETILRL